MDIVAKAAELGNMLKQSNLYETYKMAEQVYIADHAAQEKTAAYNAKRLEYAKKIHTENLSEQDAQPYVDELNQDFEDLQKIESIALFIASKQKFEELYQNTLHVIEHAISGEESGCGSGGCSSCSGCH